MKFLLALLLTLAPSVALAQIGTSQLGNELRTHDKLILGYALADGTASATAGTRGVVAVGAIGAGTSITITTGIFPPPYAARLVVRMHDAANAGAVTCSSVVISGRNQFGINVSEKTTADEDGVTTKHAYERVDRIVASGCAGTAANDRLHVYAGPYVAVDRVLQSNADIVVVCQRDPNAAEFALCVPGSACTVDAFSGTVSIASCTDLSAVAGDAITIRTRSKWKGSGGPVFQR